VGYFPTSSGIVVNFPTYVYNPGPMRENKDTDPNVMTPAPSLVRALRHLLRPLVRLLVARGVTYTMLSDLVKQIYVDVADRDFRLDGKAQTDSRVSLLSGVHRKDVRRLRGASPVSDETVPESVALGAQLVSAWTTRREFADAKGKPRPLPRLASQGGARSFESLVASVSKDIRARSILDEWLRLGVVGMDKQDRVVLRTAAFVPRRGFDEKAYYLGHNGHDHLAAAAHNLLGEGKPFLERSVHYNELGERSVGELAQLAERAGMEALHKVNRKVGACEARDRAEPPPRRRITFGVYFFSEPERSD
jgi:uncharacterized protein DUF6502